MDDQRRTKAQLTQVLQGLQLLARFPRRRKFSITLLILSLFAFGAQSAFGDDSVTLHLQWLHQFQFAGYYAAQEKGYFAEEGLDVTIVEGGPGIENFSAVLDAPAQYGTAHAAGLLIHRANGEPVVVLATIFQHSPNAIIARADRGIQSPHDLVVGRTRIWPGGFVELSAMLLSEGIDPAPFLSEPGDDPLRGLLEGTVDAIDGYVTNEAIALREAGLSIVVISPRTYGVDFYGDVLMTSERELREHPERAIAFRRASLRGWLYAMEHPEEIVNLILREYSPKSSRDHLLSEAEAMSSLVANPIVEIGHSNTGRWQKMADTLVALDMVQPGIRIADLLFDPNPDTDLTNLYIGLAIAIAAVAVVSSVGFLLLRFNSRLRQEVREHRRAEEALRESEEHFRVALKSAPITVFNQDCDLRFTWVHNPDPYFESESLIGKTDADIVAHDDAVAVMAIKRRVIESGEGVRREISLTADGNTLFYDLIVEPLHGTDGNIVGITCASVDVTGRKQAEEERRSMERQVQHSQKLESLGVLAGGIAHDFNNLLTTILGYAELALNDLSPQSPVRAGVEAIQDAGRRAASLTNQMLAYSGRGAFESRLLNLSEDVGEIAHLLSVSVSKKVTLTTRLEPSVPAIRADAAQLQQVVMNLITNASEAIDEGESGVITVSTGVRDCDRKYLADSYLAEKQPEGRYVYIEVADTGSGMDEETKATLFDPFFSTKFTGRGLGLAAVLGIVRGHRGAIMVESEVGKGSTIRVLFPVAAGETAEPTAPTDITRRVDWKGTGTVLVVDDEDSVRRLAVTMLERLGFETLQATDGEDAVEVFRKHAGSITFVLLDLTMPRMDGGEAFLEIQKIRDDVPVILSSGYSEAELSERFGGFGMAGFIQKPYQPAKFAGIFRRLAESSE